MVCSSGWRTPCRKPSIKPPDSALDLRLIPIQITQRSTEAWPISTLRSDWCLARSGKYLLATTEIPSRGRHLEDGLCLLSPASSRAIHLLCFPATVPASRTRDSTVRTSSARSKCSTIQDSRRLSVQARTASTEVACPEP